MAQINLTKTTTPTTPSPNRAGMFINNSNDLIIIDENGSLIPTGESITGGTFSNTVLNLVKSDGSTVVVTGFTDNDIFVTGGTFSNNVLNLENNDGSTVVVTGFTDFYTTGATLNNTTLEFNTVNQQNAYNTDLSSLVGVTGGTYNSNTDEIEFTGTQPNSSFSFSVSGLSQDIFVTGGTYNNNNGVVTFNNNNGNSFSVSGFITGFTDFYTTGATLNNTTLEFNRTDQSNAYDVDLSSLDWTGGTNYILVKAEGTDTENATELQAAYDLAVSASTVMSASSDNRITIIAAPGNYNFDSNFVMDEEFIDLVSLDGKRSVIFNGLGTISITATDTLVRGVDVLTKPFKIGHNLLNLIVEDCRGGDESFGYADSGTTLTINGTFIDCVAGNNSFGHRPNIGGNSQINLNINGTFTNCTAGNNSFGYNTNNQLSSPTTLTFNSAKLTNCTAGNHSFGVQISPTAGSQTQFNFSEFTNCNSGDESFGYIDNANGLVVPTLNPTIFENCEGGSNSFCTGTLGTSTVIFKNCVGGNSSFFGEGTLAGKFENCVGNGGSFGFFGEEASGTFTNCQGGIGSFGYLGAASGTFTNCQGGDNSFGSGSGGDASGTFTNCVGGDDSFGGNGGSLSGRVIRCQLTTGTFETPTGSGKIILGIDGNDNIINLTA